MTDTTTRPPQPRIPQLDVLRGLAILGILMVNAPVFAMPAEVFFMGPELSPLPFDPADQRVWWTMRTLFEQKFINLFSLLFGASLFLVGGERDDPVREPVLVRRLLWLAVFGAVHGALIWFGDILLHYAMVGFLVFLFRSWPARKLVVVGSVWVGVSSLLYLALHGFLEIWPADAMERSVRPLVRDALAGFRGDLAQVQAENLADFAPNVLAGLFLQGPRTLGLMLLGLGLYKSGVFEGRAGRGVYVAMLAAGAISLVVIGWSSSAHLAGIEPGAGLIGAPNSVLSPLVTLGYIAAVVLLLRGGAGRAVGRALAPVGRMAFTNYLTQSLIMTTIFYGARGFGWYGRLDWADWVWIVVAVWAVQLVWSPLWLSRFTMGPFEWVWRRLSYGRDIPLRRTDLPARAAISAA